MSRTKIAGRPSVWRFRARLVGAMMLVVSALTVLALYFGQRNLTATAERDLRQNFETEISALHKLQGLRHTQMAERCRRLSSNARIHAALEDNALDLLYPSAQDELRDLMGGGQATPQQSGGPLRAKFYRFLDNSGRVLPPPNSSSVGRLSEDAEALLALPQLATTPQTGYIRTGGANAPNEIEEVIVFPIFSSETGAVISALVVGFQPFEFEPKGAGRLQSGIWLNGSLRLPSLPPADQQLLSDRLAAALRNSNAVEKNFTVVLNHQPHLVFYKLLNPNSAFPPAYEICLYPLTDWMMRLHRLRWEIGAAGVLLLLGGFVASRFIASRLSQPVEQLAADSEQNRARRQKAEAALASTAEKLERSTRYSADASHQLKSPITILRSGIEILLAREDFKPEIYHELSALLHQTHRLTGVIDDLLLLSRMDAGHLEIDSEPVNLSQLIVEWLEDLQAIPDSRAVKVETHFESQLYIAGEKRYTSLIIQNLLENAHKYNRPGGLIRVSTRVADGQVILTIGNTGFPIAPSAQKDVFERFHRGATRTSVSGHGIGLNLARQLARLHGGELNLVRSADDWTEFEVRFRAITAAPAQFAVRA